MKNYIHTSRRSSWLRSVSRVSIFGNSCGEQCTGKMVVYDVGNIFVSGLTFLKLNSKLSCLQVAWMTLTLWLNNEFKYVGWRAEFLSGVLKEIHQKLTYPSPASDCLLFLVSSLFLSLANAIYVWSRE
ncbi:hypothetical protein AAHA92_14766 [Salvia divinorum]|uniref:Uncharacterized protein n=1 Tax=Salvia divinorum TaxID=28513 RepID=A0ABD1HF56_SALDI